MLVSENTSDNELADRVKEHSYMYAEVLPEEWADLAKEIIEKTANAKSYEELTGRPFPINPYRT